MRDKTTTGLIYRESGTGENRHNITAVQQVLRLVPNVKMRMPVRNEGKKTHKLPLTNNRINPAETPKIWLNTILW